MKSPSLPEAHAAKLEALEAYFLWVGYMQVSDWPRKPPAHFLTRQVLETFRAEASCDVLLKYISAEQYRCCWLQPLDHLKIKSPGCSSPRFLTVVPNPTILRRSGRDLRALIDTINIAASVLQFVTQNKHCQVPCHIF